MKERLCRICGSKVEQSFVDLGMSPLSNAYVECENLQAKENFYPLHAYVCANCFLVQIEEFESPQEIFRDYAYFSSFSKSWLEHAEKYTEMIINRFNLTAASKVIEVASNDGYLLQYFKKQGMPVLGIEPAENIAREAVKKGIPTEIDFFGVGVAERIVNKNIKADLLIGNNVLAHVPNINDFLAGMKKILNEDGIITMEFPHLLQLINKNQFDTIYHEHFSYLSLITTHKLFENHGLEIFDVEEILTHGGSLRIYAKHKKNNTHQIQKRVAHIFEKERKAHLDNIETYRFFSEQVKKTKRNILQVLIDLKNQGKQIVGYGAPAKGNTLLNYCGIGKDFIDYVVDLSPYKQGLFLPGTHIPIYAPDKVKETKPDYMLIFPWNIREEIVEQMDYIRQWGGHFIILIPEIEIV